MSQRPQYNPSQPPPPPNGGGRASGSPVWWLVAAVAGVVSVALVVWLVVSSGSNPATPAPTPSSGTPSTTESSTPPATPPTATTGSPATEPAAEWGDFPPANLDSLKDLSGASFPTTVGTYTFDGEDRTDLLVIAGYRDDTVRTMGADLFLQGASTTDYRTTVERWEDVAYYGRAVCGISTLTASAMPHCVMVGTSQRLQVGTATEGTTLEEVAAFTEELYDSL